MQPITPYSPTNKIRIVTAGSLFDGHDAAINIMRRILQSSGGEVIHLGHNRSVHEIVNTAVQEDAQAIATTSYQGGHLEFFKYMVDLLQEQGCGHIKIFGGGGGTKAFCSQPLRTTNADMAKAMRETPAIPRRVLPSEQAHGGERVGIISVPQLCFVLEISSKKNFRRS